MGKKSEDNKCSARVTIVVLEKTKQRWMQEIERRHWNMTTLIKVAVERFLESEGSSSES